jgi:hypothetical protein
VKKSLRSLRERSENTSKKLTLKSLLYQSTEKLLGRSIAKALYFQQKKHLLRGQKLLFVHIPRTGGTSVSKALYGGTIGHLHLSEWENLLRAEQFEQYTSFSIIRNPFDRLLSAYHFLRKRRQLPKRIIKITEPREAFVVFVKEWLVQQDLSKADFTLEPQHPYVGSYVDGQYRQQVQRLFCYEQMEEVEVFLQEQSGRNIRLQRFNQIRREHDREYYYDAETKALVYALYRVDFELGGYDV